jgi:hypothetical protein
MDLLIIMPVLQDTLEHYAVTHFFCGHNTAGSTPGGLLLLPYVLSPSHLFCTLKLLSLQEGFHTLEQVIG